MAPAPVPISVVIPAHNRTAVIPRAIDSVLAQNVPVQEVIVVDDSSTDGLEALVTQRYRDAPVRYLRNAGPRGAQGARNTGIRSAKSAWVAFQDSDDTWEPDKIECQWACRSGDDESVLIHSGAWFVNEAAGSRTYVDIGRPYVGHCTPRLLAHHGPLFPSFLTQKAALERIGYLDTAVPSYQEWDTAIQLSKVARLVFVDRPLFSYYCRRDDAISADARREVAGRKYILTKYTADMRTSIPEGRRCRIYVKEMARASRAGCRDAVQGYLELALSTVRNPLRRARVRFAHAWLARRATPLGGMHVERSTGAQHD